MYHVPICAALVDTNIEGATNPPRWRVRDLNLRMVDFIVHQ